MRRLAKLREPGNRSGLGWWAAAFALSLAAALPECRGRSPSPDAPDLVLLIVVDTLRRDHVGVYGGNVATPHMDALAARGQVFTNAVASFHQTTMSMGAILTGMTPSIESDDPAKPLPWNAETWCGMSRFRGDEPGGGCFPTGMPTLASAMRSAGYRTAAVVTNDLLFRPAGYDAGFETWIEVTDEKERTRRIAAGEDPWDAASHSRTGSHVNREVRSLLPSKAHGKHFLYLHYNDVHDHRIHGTYPDGVRAFDRSLGELFGQLEAAGWMTHARVVLTADHGEMLDEEHVIPFGCGRSGHCGNPSYTGLLAVPLLVSGRTRRDPGAMLRGEDILDLVAEIVPLEVRRSHPRVLEPDELYLSEAAVQTYQRGRWKALRRRNGGGTLLLDLVSDPGETRDVAREEPAVLRALQDRIDLLGRSLAAARIEDRALTEEEAARLESLGYLKR